jgi:anthraniloyl-CoA monooxygenase
LFVGSTSVWFENVARYADQDAVALAYAMASRQGQRPPWAYHLATQVPVLPWAQHAIDAARRRYLAVRRGEVPLIGPKRVAAPSR